MTARRIKPFFRQFPQYFSWPFPHWFCGKRLPCSDRQGRYVPRQSVSEFFCFRSCPFSYPSFSFLPSDAKKAVTNCYVHNCPYAVFYNTKKLQIRSLLPLLCNPVNSHTSGRSVRCPHRNCTVILWLNFIQNFRSIIITDMLHRPAQLLCILSGSYRSMPLFFTLFQIRASTSRRTYLVATHILTSCMYCDIQLSNCPSKNARQPSTASYIFWASPVRREWAYCCTTCNHSPSPQPPLL